MRAKVAAPSIERHPAPSIEHLYTLTTIDVAALRERGGGARSYTWIIAGGGGGMGVMAF